MMKTSDQYVKIVEWSEEDQCYVGNCPGLFYGGCHGPAELDVFTRLCQVVDETIEWYAHEGRSLRSPTAVRDFANKMQAIV